jgi:hypothetical protein
MFKYINRLTLQRPQSFMAQTKLQHILDFDTAWIQVVSFTFRLPYALGNTPWRCCEIWGSHIVTMLIFWVVTLCGLVGRYHHFEGTLVPVPTCKSTCIQDQHKLIKFLIITFSWLAGGMQSESSWLRIGTGGGSCEYGDEPAGSGAMDLVL